MKTPKQIQAMATIPSERFSLKSGWVSNPKRKSKTAKRKPAAKAKQGYFARIAAAFTPKRAKSNPAPRSADARLQALLKRIPPAKAKRWIADWERAMAKGARRRSR